MQADSGQLGALRSAPPMDGGDGVSTLAAVLIALTAASLTCLFCGGLWVYCILARRVPRWAWPLRRRFAACGCGRFADEDEKGAAARTSPRESKSPGTAHDSAADASGGSWRPIQEPTTLVRLRGSV